MAEGEKMPSTNVTVDFDVREALDILKRRDKVKKMSDVIKQLLLEHEPDAMKDAGKLTRIKLGWDEKGDKNDG